MKQALVVDDHPVVRDSLKEFLEKTFPMLQVQTSSGHGNVVEEICGKRWVFVVLDINLPNVHGLDIVKQAKTRQPETPIIVFSLHAESHYAARALRAGAVAYFSKDRSPTALVGLVKQLLDGKKVRTSITERPALSDREMQILTLIGRGMKRSAIALELGINEKTVSTYQGRLLQKLELRNVVELVRYAVEEGLID
jgi:DNA-binding NarL/FixJ family response regulator